VAKYFDIVPALFIASIPALQALNIMGLKSPESAILSAIIFNAIIIPMLIPLALKGVKYRPIGASSLLRRNLLIYGLGGVILPFNHIVEAHPGDDHTLCRTLSAAYCRNR
jgi:K+-transporting ATPase ATPase B chain